MRPFTGSVLCRFDAARIDEARLTAVLCQISGVERVLHVEEELPAELAAFLQRLIDEGSTLSRAAVRAAKGMNLDLLRFSDGRISLGTLLSVLLVGSSAIKLALSDWLELPEWHQLAWWLPQLRHAGGEGHRPGGRDPGRSSLLGLTDNLAQGDVGAVRAQLDGAGGGAGDGRRLLMGPPLDLGEEQRLALVLRQLIERRQRDLGEALALHRSAFGAPARSASITSGALPSSVSCTRARLRRRSSSRQVRCAMV